MNMESFQIPIKVETRKFCDILMFDVTIGASRTITLYVKEAIELVRKIEEKL